MTVRTVLVAFSMMAAVACGGGPRQEPTLATGDRAVAAPEQSLYVRLGGKAGIAAVVDQFVANVGADNRINAFFANTDLAAFKALLVDQICDAASGGAACTYRGRSMKEAHAGMGVRPEHFAALVEQLVEALDTAGVGPRERDELLGVLGGMQADIVEN